MSVVFQKGDQTWDTGLCMQGLNLLAHAQMIELSIGSECGGHGRCGRDRIRISAEDSGKLNPHTPIEKAHLNEAEISQGLRLACQCFPSKDGISLTVLLPT